MPYSTQESDPAVVGTAIVEENTGPGGIYSRMEDQGLVFERYDEERRRFVGLLG